MINTCDNPDLSDYFDKDFAEYHEGFQLKGKNWLLTPSHLMDL